MWYGDLLTLGQRACVSDLPSSAVVTGVPWAVGCCYQPPGRRRQCASPEKFFDIEGSSTATAWRGDFASRGLEQLSEAFAEFAGVDARTTVGATVLTSRPLPAVVV